MRVQAFRDLISQFAYQLASLKSAATPAERLAEARLVLKGRAELIAAQGQCVRATPGDRERAASWIGEADRVIAEAPGLRAELDG